MRVPVLNIRLAVPADARAIAEFSRDFIERDLVWRYTESRIGRAIQNRRANVAVVRERGGLLGFGIMEYGETSAHLILFGVQPTRRRRGVGRHIYRWLEKCAVTAGLEKVRVEARADNPGAVAFYEKQGFAVVERSAGYYQGVIDCVRLEKSLVVASGIART
jgi:ribosomal protein S18 acetylase RimI-like enzyme